MKGDQGGVVGCMACDLMAGRMTVPGGSIHETTCWRVEHCIGPLGVGTLIVKPKRHVTAVAALAPEETAELGPLIQRVSEVVTDLTGAQQVYVCLWSHAGGTPGHIHFVVQPVTRSQMARYRGYGPHLQSEMFAAEEPVDRERAAAFAGKARAKLTGVAQPSTSR